ncbi:MAG TPA: DNA polymerase IV [Acidimicrobiales bacterium]|jgi:DNA polymerase-4|nr:DNA polymerase IV [Acidimicrobiales bacterium]
MRDEPSILHVDMDAFFASVEVLHDPSLKGKPVVVGGTGNRGVVASCTYEARAYGIRSAMPSVRARRLCPHAVFVHGRYDAYAEVSGRIFDVFRSFTPLVEGISLDEAFLDVAGARRLFGTPHDIAGEIRRRVFDETGLTCSVGGSTTKFIAKLASEAAKPSASFSGPVPGLGVKIVEPGDELAFLHPLPVQALWGVGPATLAKLERYGLRTVGDLAALSVETLVGAVGDSHGRHLHALAWARDERVVVSEQRAKSIGHEETYAEDKHERADLAREAVRMGDAVASRLRKHGVAGRTVTIKVRFHDFQTITRSHTLAAPVDTGHAIAQVASALLEQVDPSSGVRLFGVSVSNLQEGAAQLTLDDTGWGRATAAVDDIRERFGDAAVGPAALVDAAGRLRVKRRGEQQWGPGRDGGTAT